ncbi:hypothetical protein INR49_006892 [Caranx melampygus]|nr:hypothetical protein INR49_006892 [Caranx melampygus]
MYGRSRCTVSSAAVRVSNLEAPNSALEKLQAQSSSSCGPVEVALPGLVFDLSSLVLYGAQAVPVRLKILLDRLYSILTPEQVGHILPHWAGVWEIMSEATCCSGKVLDRWTMVTPEEELLVLKQFLRFAVQCLVPPTKDLAPPMKLAQKPNGTKLAERHRLNRGRGTQENDSIFTRSCKAQAALLFILSHLSPPPSSVHFLPPPFFIPPSSSIIIFLLSSSPIYTLLPAFSFALRRSEGEGLLWRCGKSFYDKGTLKIHYNAVHLKIKHRCTVAGCTMVFSSLRSRNRHSANPNPRLHTGASRDAHTQRNTHSDPHKRGKRSEKHLGNRMMMRTPQCTCTLSEMG